MALSNQLAQLTVRAKEAEDRLAMVQAAVRGIDGLEASGLEIERGGVTHELDAGAIGEQVAQQALEQGRDPGHEPGRRRHLRPPRAAALGRDPAQPGRDPGRDR